jgi:hypothetical protein
VTCVKGFAKQISAFYTETAPLATENSYYRTVDEVFTEIIVQMVQMKRFSMPSRTQLQNPFREVETPVVFVPVVEPKKWPGCSVL